MNEQDIRSFDDLHRLVNYFYTQAMNDPIIGFFFTQVSPIELQEHTPKVARFWENILFGKSKIPSKKPKTIKKQASDVNSAEKISTDISENTQIQSQNEPTIANMLQVHLDLDDKARLQTGHFTRWLYLFIGSIDELYAGENAERLKKRAKKMASSLSDAIRSKRGEDRVGDETLN